jgi:hypothetical protein
VGKIAINIELSNPFLNDSSEFLLERVKEIAAVEECDDISSVAKPTYPSGEPLASIYWRIMICNRLFSGAVPPPEMAQVEPIFRDLMSHVDDIMNQRDYEKLDIYMLRHDYDGNKYTSAVGRWASGRVFCATEGRYLGWLPRGAEKGDVVCILEGGEVPLVMRLANDGRYQVLGDCYIHGIMDGEAMKREGLVKEKFCIY